MRRHLQGVLRASGATILPEHGSEAAVLGNLADLGTVADLGARGLVWQLRSLSVWP